MELRNRKFNHMYVGITQEFEPYGDRVVVSQSGLYLLIICPF